jgi:hypothetical protein
MNGHSECAVYLLDSCGADPYLDDNYDRVSPLHVACASGKLIIVIALLYCIDKTKLNAQTMVSGLLLLLTMLIQMRLLVIERIYTSSLRGIQRPSRSCRFSIMSRSRHFSKESGMKNREYKNNSQIEDAFRTDVLL